MLRQAYRLFSILFMLVLFIGATPTLAKSPKVVASIGPIHSIASAIMNGVGEPHLIIRPGDSAHHFHLRPSDVRALSEADHIFWIGPELEVFLTKPISALSNNHASRPLDDLHGLKKLKPRQLKEWKIEEYHEEENSEHSKKHSDHSEKHEDHSEKHSEHSEHSEHVDMHLWMDPDNALIMAEFIATTLINSDKDNQEIYRNNLGIFTNEINSISDNINKSLKEKSSQEFLLNHDAFQYFEARYGLKSIGSVTLYHDQKPGAAHIRDLKTRIDEQDVSCFLSTAKASDALLETLFDTKPIKSVASDPLGGQFPAGRDQYLQMIRSTAEQLADCLAS